MIGIGIDIGSTAAKAAVVDGEGSVAWTCVQPTGFSSVDAAERLREALAAAGYNVATDDVRVIATGYGRVAVPYAHKVVTEITCHGAGAVRLFGEQGTVIDVGGQDTKVIQLKGGRVAKFAMNDKCAAGTGRFLEIMADRLGISQQQMADLARSGEPTKISSMCTVFAESEVISQLADQALVKAGLTRKDIDAVAVTYAPGLIGAVLVGVSFAKSVAYALGVPLIPVHHVRGHIAANYIAHPDLEPPFVCLCVSGGTSLIVDVRGYTDVQILGATRDDAAGECFDKIARVMGLGYPGGPIISKLAETGNPKAIDFPRALNSRGDYRFSLSGLKTAVTLYIEQETKAGRTIHLPDLAASFEAAVFDVQYKKAKNALHATGCKEYCIGGGVSANPHLREMMIKKLGRQGIRVTVPPLSACTDNAAMIAEVARRKFDRGEISPFDVDADPNMTL